MLEYGLTNGKPFIPSLPPKHSQMIDIGTVRAEAVRGVWVLRDDANILVNFGPQRNDAEQAAAVCKRYGFNRLAQIGGANPSMSILFAQLGQELGRTPGQNAAMNGVAAVFQEQNLQRTGIEIPGVGYIGERIVIDPRKLEIKRKDRTGPWVIMSGSESLAEFGASEWSARDGLKLLQDLRVTEFCRINDQVSFFLVNGAAPSRVPFAVQSTSFDPLALRIRPASGGTVAVYEGNGRLLFPVRNEAEGEALIKLIKHYKFDQQCQMGLSTRNGLKFLARSGR
jgi:hypothetical protein